MQPIFEDDGYEIPLNLLDEDDAPELTEAWFRDARPAQTLFTELWGEEKAEAFLAANRARLAEHSVMLAVDADVVAAFRQTGPGWQERINAALRQAMPR
jgi:uncharacterized protein (DUF4415 family)